MRPGLAAVAARAYLPKDLPSPRTMMTFTQLLDRKPATAIRLAGLILIGWTVLSSSNPPTGHGRGLVVLICLVGVVLMWL